MQAVLYICHGSRVEKAANQAIEFVEKTMKLVDVPIQEYCFLELAKPTIDEGIQRCIEQGAKKIAVVPVLLLTAAHAKKDIPNVLKQASKHYKNVEFSYGKPIGVQEKMVDVLVERIKEKTSISQDLHVLLVGRGSSDPDAKIDTQKIADTLKNKSRVSSVRICFLAAARPTYEEALIEAVETGANRIVVLPYLLFTGILMKEIEQTAQQLRLSPEQEVIVCDYLGSHRNVCEQLKARVIEAIREGEKYATMA
ncbi:sirohydrochlorin chelatase [Aquibacillus albus]|uniref:Sirohydrochlorin ferrochelatase n=1 Tax=Aquibacillus albus TaxID=1168171 RepID=A0ABS2N4Z8_9BACI|nr:sirohydrochlorin chelatase [Aquibacillus albus]MBM7573220.1 sirohydrochlorin ferrochelatase [Aquibacillus albus]